MMGKSDLGRDQVHQLAQDQLRPRTSKVGGVVLEPVAEDATDPAEREMGTSVSGRDGSSGEQEDWWTYLSWAYTPASFLPSSSSNSATNNEAMSTGRENRR